MIARSFESTSSPLARAIVPVTPKTIASPAAESASTCRNEPGPLSAREVTVFVPDQPKGGLTVTVKSQLAVSPHESVARQDTVVVPIGKVEPLGGSQVMLAPLQPPLVEEV
jgi:hypothetical protein